MINFQELKLEYKNHYITSTETKNFSNLLSEYRNIKYKIALNIVKQKIAIFNNPIFFLKSILKDKPKI